MTPECDSLAICVLSIKSNGHELVIKFELEIISNCKDWISQANDSDDKLTGMA